MDLADRVWEQNKWDEQNEKEFLMEHNRTPFKHKKSENSIRYEYFVGFNFKTFTNPLGLF